MPIAVDEQLTMRELLTDPLYKKWLWKTPLPTHTTTAKPWRVWIQREPRGRWARKDFEKYAPAMNLMVRMLREGCHDAAVSHKVSGFKPPVIREKGTKQKRYHIPSIVGQNAQHIWCPHCRRPTIFTTFGKHHAFGSRVETFIHYNRRCAICGISITAIRTYR